MEGPAAILLVVSGLCSIRSVGEQFACKTPSLLYIAVINIVAVAVYFLISLLFPVNCF